MARKQVTFNMLTSASASDCVLARKPVPVGKFDACFFGFFFLSLLVFTFDYYSFSFFFFRIQQIQQRNCCTCPYKATRPKQQSIRPLSLFYGAFFANAVFIIRARLLLVPINYPFASGISLCFIHGWREMPLRANGHEIIKYIMK